MAYVNNEPCIGTKDNSCVPAAAIAGRLGLPLESVRRRRRALAPVRPRGRPYAAEEEELLRDALACGRSLRELAFELGRTEGAPVRLSRLLGRSDRAVLRRIRALGLASASPHRLPPAASGVTEGELRPIARECSGGGPRRVLTLARRLGRRPGDVRRLAEEVCTAGATATIGSIDA